MLLLLGFMSGTDEDELLLQISKGFMAIIYCFNNFVVINCLFFFFCYIFLIIIFYTDQFNYLNTTFQITYTLACLTIYKHDASSKG